jgi:8-oxo-dGTP pyrophosphatase MutT (NUDIX family)
VNPDLSPKESAVKELFEEAGATGKLIDKKFGTYSYKKWGGKCKVKVFGLLVENIMERWEENFRERKWINENEVELFIGNKKLLKIIKDFFQSEDHKK